LAARAGVTIELVDASKKSNIKKAGCLMRTIPAVLLYVGSLGAV